MFKSLFRRQFSTNPFKFIQCEAREAALWVIINNPILHNSFSEVLISELKDCFSNINPNRYRAVVLTGNGKSFSAGADLNWMKKMANYTQQENEADAKRLFDMIHSIHNCPLPVIGRINGSAFGGGCGLVSACDFSYAVNSAYFGFTEVKLGIVPAVISWFVMNKIGHNASRYFITGERFDTKQAIHIGLLQDCFKTMDEMDAQITKDLEHICTSSPNAVHVAKKLISKVNEFKTSEESRDFVSKLIADIRGTPQAQKGMQSFLNKQKPNWN